MIDPEEAKRLHRLAMDSTPSGDDWTALSASEFATELAPTHSRYVVHELIGRGGMGAVYRADDRQDSRPVAIKMLRTDAHHDESYLRRFDDESMILRRLDHPNIVRCLDAGQTSSSGYRFLVMPWLEGRTLAEELKTPGRLTLKRRLKLLAEICAGVDYMHRQGIVHRDLKAANIMIIDGDDRAVVLDLGIARDVTVAVSTMSRLHGTPGTPSHIAPELRQAEGQPVNRTEATPLSDVYSLGVVASQVLTWQLPDAGSPKPSDFGLDARFDAIVAKALHPIPGERYRTAAEFAEALKAAAEPVVPRAIAPELMLPPLPSKPIASDSVKTSPEQSNPSSLPTKKDRALVFPLPDELARLRNLLASVSSAQITAAPSIDPSLLSQPKLALRLVGKCDASQKSPKTNPSVALPHLVSWHPNGQHLVTGCGHWGCTYWEIAEMGLRAKWRDDPDFCYWLARGVYWSESGDRFIFHSQTSMNEYVHIYRSARYEDSGPPQNAPCGEAQNWPQRWSLRSRGCSPWRPGTSSFLAIESTRCSLHEHGSIVPTRVDKQPTEWSWLELISRPFSDEKPYRTVDFPLSSRDGLSLSVADLGAQIGAIDRLSWHPSGLFLAVGTGRWDAAYAPVVRIVHFETATVIAKIADAKVLGWSNRGTSLLLDFGSKKKSGGPSAENRFAVWDSSLFAVRPLTKDEASSMSFASLIAEATFEANSNADGSLVVRDSSIIRVSDGAVVGKLSAKDAEWSPIDPARLATVGGHDLCVWDLTIER